jgi:hypothetical protein
VIDQYELYQGIALREIIRHANPSVSIKPFKRRGRVNAFVLNGRIGIFIKHSSKRLSPWQFTFKREHKAEVRRLQKKFPQSYLVLVCGMDGLVTVDAETLQNLIDAKSRAQAWVRIDRKPRCPYYVTGSCSENMKKLAAGVTEISGSIAGYAP